MLELTEELKGAVEWLLESQQQIVEKGDEVMPVAYLILPGGKNALIFMPWHTDAEKYAVRDRLHAAVRRAGARAVVLAADTWIGTPRSPLRPREQPNRREAITITVHTPAGSWGESYPYKRIRHAGGQLQIVWEKPLSEEQEQPPDGVSSIFNPWGDIA